MYDLQAVQMFKTRGDLIDGFLPVKSNRQVLVSGRVFDDIGERCRAQFECDE
jgi:hypothetical protein